MNSDKRKQTKDSKYRRSLLFLLFFLYGTGAFGLGRYWVSTTARNWNDVNAWSTSSGGPAGASIPSASDTVFFNSATGRCTLVGDVTIYGLDVYSSVQIDLAGFNLNVTGDRWNVIEAGTFYNSAAPSSLNFNSVGTVQLGNSAGLTNVYFNSGVFVNVVLTSGGMITTYPGAVVIFTATFAENVAIACQSVELNGGTFNANLTLTKNGASYDYSSAGGNTYNGTTIITLGAGAGDLVLVRNAARTDVFNGDVTFNNNATVLNAGIYPSYFGSTLFNGNIKINSSSDGDVYFGYNSSGTSVLSSGKTISIGASGFTKGVLTLNGFTQLGSTNQTIQLTSGGTGSLNLGSSFNTVPVIFNAASFTASAPIITQIYNATFNSSVACSFTAQTNLIQVASSLFGAIGSTCTFQLTANTNLSWNGGNTFYGATTITNSGGSRLRLSGTTKELYVGSIKFVKGGAGAFQACWSQTGNECMGDIDISGAVSFGTSGGKINLTGSANQTISGTASTIPLLAINKGISSNTVSLATTISISSQLDFQNGIVVSTAANLLIFLAGSSTINESNVSHVRGPVQKVGTSIFDFPIGNGTYYRSLGLANATASSNTFTAEYKSLPAPNSTSLGAGVNHVSTCEYWTLSRNAGTTAVTIKLTWNGQACQERSTSPYITDLTALIVARFNVTSWISEGNGGTTGTSGFGSAGSIKTSTTLSSFGNFTLASTNANNPLPVELTTFIARPFGNFNQLMWQTASEHNSKEFVVQRSSDGKIYEPIGIVPAQGTSNMISDYKFMDSSATSTKSYYRLKQIDIDLSFAFSPVVMCVNRDREYVFEVFPNPAMGDFAYFNDEYDITVFDAKGLIVVQQNRSSSLPLAPLRPGLYFILNQFGECRRLVVKCLECP